MIDPLKNLRIILTMFNNVCSQFDIQSNYLLFINFNEKDLRFIFKYEEKKGSDKEWILYKVIYILGEKS